MNSVHDLCYSKMTVIQCMTASGRLTENARVENEGGSQLQGSKMQEKMQEENAGVENEGGRIIL